MAIVIDLSDELGFDEPFTIDETNINMRRTWLIEKELTAMMIYQSGKHDTEQKKKKYIQQEVDFIDAMIKFLIDILNLNPLEYKIEFMDNLSYFDCLNAVTKITSAILHVEPIKTKDNPEELQQYRNRLKERFFTLDNAVKDFDYNELQILSNLHIAPSAFESEDYYRMNEVLSALSPDERPMTGAGFLQQLNLTKENANEALKGNK